MATHAPVPTSDSVWVVELYLPEDLRAAPDTAPQLTYRGGPLLTSVEVFTIFWGADWQSPPQSDIVDRLNGFFDDILTSPLMDQLAEYSVQDNSIGYGTRTGTITLTDPAPGSTVSDSDITDMLTAGTANGGSLPQPDPNTLYFIYLPPGVDVVQGGGKSCQVFCGYHNATDSGLYYAVMPYPGCPGCTGGLDTFDALTSTSSHELCEAITDPVPGSGWYDDVNGEIGDICAWQTKTIDQYTVQLEWSNAQGACV